MAYPGSFLRLQVSGTLYGSESYAWTLSLIPDFPTSNDAPTTVPAALVSALATFHGAMSNDGAKMTTAKLNEIGADGRYVSPTSTVLYDWASPGIAGGSVSNRMPAQVALAVSLTTAQRRGLAHAGRFYVPVPRVSVDGTGLIPDLEVTNLAPNVKTFLDAVNAAVPGYRVGVASSVGAGAFVEVTGFKVGRVLDTIRSRRASLPETYKVGAALTA